MTYWPPSRYEPSLLRLTKPASIAWNARLAQQPHRPGVLASIIGSGIFVISGTATALHGGPAVFLSLIFAVVVHHDKNGEPEQFDRGIFESLESLLMSFCFPRCAAFKR